MCVWSVWGSELVNVSNSIMEIGMSYEDVNELVDISLFDLA